MEPWTYSYWRERAEAAEARLAEATELLVAWRRHSSERWLGVDEDTRVFLEGSTDG
jgi:hypothetical protein